MLEPYLIWDEPDDLEGNTVHIAEHGVTPEEVEEILLDHSIPTAYSQSSVRPCKFGWTPTGKYLIVIWEEAYDDPRMLYPITAYEVSPPKN